MCVYVIKILSELVKNVLQVFEVVLRTMSTKFRTPIEILDIQHESAAPGIFKYVRVALGKTQFEITDVNGDNLCHFQFLKRSLDTGSICENYFL